MSQQCSLAPGQGLVCMPICSLVMPVLFVFVVCCVILQCSVCHAGIMQGYFLKLLGNYRSFIYEEGSAGGNMSSPQSNSPSSHGGSRSQTPTLRDDTTLHGHGFCFDHNALAASHRYEECAAQQSVNDVNHDRRQPYCASAVCILCWAHILHTT